MLDDVERRGFLVQPSGEDAVPPLVGLLHIYLNERTRQLLWLPGSRCFTCPKPDDHVLPASRLAGVQRDILDDAVTLVENAKHRHALRHWRHPSLAVSRRGGLARGRKGRVLLLGALAAGDKRKRDQQRNCGLSHAYSGIEGS